MSWDVSLERDGRSIPVPRHAEGGTYVRGGIAEAELNVTYNYGATIAKAWPDDDPRIYSAGEWPTVLARLLDDRRAGETIPYLRAAVAKLGTERDRDYWKPTPGNAGRALATLLAWARIDPEAVWRVS